jgi:catalase
VQVPAIREWPVSMLRNVSDELAKPVAEGRGLALSRPMPRVMEPSKSEVQQSPALSLTPRPGDGSIRGRRIAILVAPGLDGESLATAQKTLTEAEAFVRLVEVRLGPVETADGSTVEPDGTLETLPSVLFDAVVVPDGTKAATALAALGHAREFLRGQYRHCHRSSSPGSASRSRRRRTCRPTIGPIGRSCARCGRKPSSLTRS